MCIGALLWLGTPATAAPPIAELEARVAEEPQHPYWAYELALAYHEEHRLDEAIAQYRRALELDPTNSLINTSLQTALTERRILHDAFAQFDTGFALPYNSAAASYNFGIVAEKQGLVEEAHYYYSRYVALAPTASDAPSVRARLSAIDNAIMHRNVRITKLATTPDRIEPGGRGAVVFSYRVEGYGRHNSTGVIEQVSLFRDEVETHRFRQRAIRPTDRGYNATIEFLVPIDTAPGVYTLVASAIAGSKRDDQIAVFPVDPLPIEIPDPITAEEYAEMQATANLEAVQEETVDAAAPVDTPVQEPAPAIVEPVPVAPAVPVSEPTPPPIIEPVDSEPASRSPSEEPTPTSQASPNPEVTTAAPASAPIDHATSQPASAPASKPTEGATPASAPTSGPASGPASAPAAAPQGTEATTLPAGPPTSQPTEEDLPPESEKTEKDDTPESQPATQAAEEGETDRQAETPAAANVPD